MSESFKTDPAGNPEVAASEHGADHLHRLEVGVGDRALPLVKAGPAALAIGLLAILVSAAVAVFTPGSREAMAGGYLFGWYCTMSIVLGMLGIAILHHTLRASWSLPLIKLLHAGSSPAALAVMFVLYLPFLIWPGIVYEWVNPGNDHVLLKKTWWLSQPSFQIHNVIYFALFILMSSLLRNSVAKQERLVREGTAESIAEGFRIEMARSSMGAAFIVLFILTITFASTDWAMSLQPHWFSTMYPVWQLIACCLGAGGLVVALLCLNARKAPYTSVIGPNVTKDWGNILFMFTMLWAYTAVSQFLIIWNGNLPETASYFARRGQMGWNAVGMAVIVGQFLVPWMILLSPRIKRYPHLLRGVAGWILVVHILDVYYAVVPALPNGGFGHGHGLFPGQHLLYELLGLVATFGVWFYAFFRGVSATENLLPNYDNRLQEALAHAH